MKNGIVLSLFATGALAFLFVRRAIESRKEFHIAVRPVRKESGRTYEYKRRLMAFPTQLDFLR